MGTKSSARLEFAGYMGLAFIADLIIPIFALFLPLLMLEVGGNLLEVGLVGGLAYAFYSFMPFFLGKYSDRIHSKRLFLIVSFSILTSVSFVYSIAPNPITLIAARLVEGLGWAVFWPSLQSMMTRASSMDPKKVYSIYNTVWSSSYAIGPLIAGVLATIRSVLYVFYITTLAFAVGLAINVIFYYYESRSIRGSISDSSLGNSKAKAAKEELDQGKGAGSSSKSFFFLAIAVSTLSTTVLLTFFPPFAKNSEGLSVLAISVITTAYGFTRFLYYLLSLNHRVRVGVFDPRMRKTLVVLLLGVIATASALLLHDTTGEFSLILFALIGFAYSMTGSIGQISIIAEAPAGKMGAAAGTFETSIGIGAFLGPVIAGVLSQSGLLSPFLLPALGLGAFLVALYGIREVGNARQSRRGKMSAKVVE